MIPSKMQVPTDPSYQYQTGQSDKAEPCSDDQTYAKLSISGTTLRNRKDRDAKKAVKDWTIDVQQPTVSA
uniref:hypothetical protein n=1 Tax=Endozoicomonas sp. ONNA2 TaxID=2828741 RepID=UPI0021476729